MSGKNNVNPDHYKVAGRDRPNEVLVSELHVPADSAYLPPAKGRRAPNFIPGALPVGEAPPPRKRASKPAARSGAKAARARTGAKPAKKRATGTGTRKRSGAARGKRASATRSKSATSRKRA